MSQTLVRGAPASAVAPPRPARLSRKMLLLSLASVAAAVLVGVLIGPVGLNPLSVIRALFGFDSRLTEQQRAILFDLRLPRVVLAALVGAMLSCAGAAYQGAFRNPLADPYLLGAAAGAGLGVTMAIAYAHPGAARDNLIPLASFAGALIAVAIAYTIGRSIGGRTVTSLVLSGIAVTSFVTAVQTFVQQHATDDLREIYTWILGRLSTAGWHDVVLVLPYIAGGSAMIIAHGRLLDVLSVGDEEAQSLGIQARRVRLSVVVAASLGTAAAVSVSGLIGFVGIIVPHTIRLFTGPSYRVLLPLTVAFGAVFMILADVVARTALAPGELPIGVVTALIGAPFFAFVLRSSRRLA